MFQLSYSVSCDPSCEYYSTSRDDESCRFPCVCLTTWLCHPVGNLLKSGLVSGLIYVKWYFRTLLVPSVWTNAHELLFVISNTVAGR